MLSVKNAWRGVALAGATVLIGGALQTAEAANYTRPVEKYLRDAPFRCSPTAYKYAIDAFGSTNNCNGIAVSTGGTWNLNSSGDGFINDNYAWMDKSSPGSAGANFYPTITVKGYYRVTVGFRRSHARSRDTAWDVYAADLGRDKSPNVYRYHVLEYDQPEGANWAQFGLHLFDKRNASDKGKKPGWVRLNNSNIASESVDAVHLELVVPYNVTGFAATQGLYTDRVKLTWLRTPLAVKYQVFRNQGSKPLDIKHDYLGSVLKGQGLGKLDLAAEPGLDYNYWVRAVTADGYQTKPVDKRLGWVAVPAPTALTATPGQGVVNLTWTAPAKGAVKYQIFRDSMAAPVATIPAPALGYTDTPGDTAAHNYSVRVLGANGRASSLSLSGPVSGAAQ